MLHLNYFLQEKKDFTICRPTVTVKRMNASWWALSGQGTVQRKVIHQRRVRLISYCCPCTDANVPYFKVYFVCKEGH